MGVEFSLNIRKCIVFLINTNNHNQLHLCWIIVVRCHESLIDFPCSAHSIRSKNDERVTVFFLPLWLARNRVQLHVGSMAKRSYR